MSQTISDVFVEHLVQAGANASTGSSGIASIRSSMRSGAMGGCNGSMSVTKRKPPLRPGQKRN